MNDQIPKEEALEQIDSLADEADELVLETMKRLQKTFITPMDREDIQQLTNEVLVTAGQFAKRKGVVFA